MDRATREKLRGLAKLAAVTKEAELAKLAALSAELAARQNARAGIEAALAEEIAVATGNAEVPVLRALDAHVVLSERALGALDADIARIATSRDAQRAACVVSFGRSQVLRRLYADACAGKPAS